MNQRGYQQKVIECRYITTRVQNIANAQIMRALRSAYDDLERLLGLAKKESLTTAFYTARKNAIAEIMRDLTMGINSTVRFSAKSVIQKTTDVYADTVQKFAEERGFKYDWGGAFSTVPSAALRGELGRLYLDGRNFSDRLWRMGSGARTAVNEIISSGIARGQSAVNMSKDLRQYLVNPELTPGTTWTTGVRPSVSGRGTINYNALRLARTEINNSYREATAELNGRNPITAGVKWNLSATHPYPDVCDLFAEVDSYGMGPGVYPANATPIDHPNGKCYITEVLRPTSQWGEPKQDRYERQLSESEVLRPLQNKSQMKEYEVRAAYKMWDKTRSLIQSENVRQRRAA